MMQNDESKLNEIFIYLSKKYGMNPLYLKQIISLRNMGYNNTQIATSTGISRVTVNTYIEKIKQHESLEDFKKLMLLGLGLFAGYQIVKELFGE